MGLIVFASNRGLYEANKYVLDWEPSPLGDSIQKQKREDSCTQKKLPNLKRF
jgi:hypothetical protein